MQGEEGKGGGERGGRSVRGEGGDRLAPSLAGRPFYLPAYYSLLETLRVASLSQPRLFPPADFSLSAACLFAQSTCRPAHRPLSSRHHWHSSPQSTGYRELGTPVTAWDPGGMAARMLPASNGGRGLAGGAGCPFCRPAARGRGLAFPRRVPVSDAVDPQLRLTRLSGTGRAGRAPPLSAAHSAPPVPKGSLPVRRFGVR